MDFLLLTSMLQYSFSAAIVELQGDHDHQPIKRLPQVNVSRQYMATSQRGINRSLVLILRCKYVFKKKKNEAGSFCKTICSLQS